MITIAEFETESHVVIGRYLGNQDCIHNRRVIKVTDSAIDSE